MKITSEQLLLKLKFHNFFFTVLFKFTDRDIDSKILKSLNKKFMKYFIMYNMYDEQCEGIFIIDNIDYYLPMIYYEIDYKNFLRIVIKWSKKSYKLIKSYSIVTLKKKIIENYLAKIEFLEKMHDYKRASIKQLNGNAKSFLERNKDKGYKPSIFWRISYFLIKCHLKASSTSYLRSSIHLMDIC